MTKHELFVALDRLGVPEEKIKAALKVMYEHEAGAPRTMSPTGEG